MLYSDTLAGLPQRGFHFVLLRQGDVGAINASDRTGAVAKPGMTRSAGMPRRPECNDKDKTADALKQSG